MRTYDIHKPKDRGELLLTNREEELKGFREKALRLAFKELFNKNIPIANYVYYMDMVHSKPTSICLLDGGIMRLTTGDFITFVSQQYGVAKKACKGIIDSYLRTGLEEYNPSLLIGERNIKQQISYYNTKFTPKRRGVKNSLYQSNEMSKFQMINLVLKNVFPEEKERNYFIHWLANIVQGNRNQTAIISKGATQGTGKGVIYNNIIKPILGKNNTVQIGTKDLLGNFTDLWYHKTFVLANEVYLNPFKDKTSILKLKEMVTDSEISINLKKIGGYTEDNTLNFWFHANDFIPFPVEREDRRYNIFKTSRTKLLSLVESYEVLANGIQEEVEKFGDMLYSLKIDKKLIGESLESQSKEELKEETIGEEALSILQHGETHRLDSLFHFYTDKQEKDSQALLRPFGGHQGILDELAFSMKHKYIKLKTLYALYRLLSKDFNSSNPTVKNYLVPYFGKDRIKRIKGKTVRVYTFE